MASELAVEGVPEAFWNPSGRWWVAIGAIIGAASGKWLSWVVRGAEQGKLQMKEMLFSGRCLGSALGYGKH